VAVQPKIKLELVVADSQLERIVNIIVDSARSGAIGDGKICSKAGGNRRRPSETTASNMPDENSTTAAARVNRSQWDANPPYGEKGAFRKVTVTLPLEIYERLVRESARRKIAGEPNQLLAAMLREALSRYLDTLDSA
jgi:hypothetical protein